MAGRIETVYIAGANWPAESQRGQDGQLGSRVAGFEVG
jgi:hypothetical protein